ncbi:hypothetical protein D3C74_377830 [compost metagenome]
MRFLSRVIQFGSEAFSFGHFRFPTLLFRLFECGELRFDIVVVREFLTLTGEPVRHNTVDFVLRHYFRLWRWRFRIWLRIRFLVAFRKNLQIHRISIAIRFVIHCVPPAF